MRTSHSHRGTPAKTAIWATCMVALMGAGLVLGGCKQGRSDAVRPDDVVPSMPADEVPEEDFETPAQEGTPEGEE